MTPSEPSSRPMQPSGAGSLASASRTDGEHVLEVRDLSSGYGEVQVLWGVALGLRLGRLTTLIGSNGAGKTTLLRSVMGLLRPWNGAVEFEGRDILGLPAHNRPDRGLVLIPEGRQLFTDLTVIENLELGAVNRRARERFVQNLQRVMDLFPRLKERRDQSTATLSGGEQQMVAVARGLMAEPKVLMLDELSLGLSPLLTITLFEALRKLRDDGLTMLLVEQNVRLALAISDDAYVLAEGRIVLSGPADEVERNPEVQRAYLGM
jgi:branched-chain amino acid transport system ATP-binding protein